MNKLSLKPDPYMRWIYDYTHPDYHSPQAISLRQARERALLNAPAWLKEEASLNDNIQEAQP